MIRKAPTTIIRDRISSTMIMTNFICRLRMGHPLSSEQSPLSSGTPLRAFLPRSYGAGTVISLAEKIAHSPLGADELGVGRIVLDLLS